MAIIKKMLDPVSGETIYPMTSSESVIMNGGEYDGESIQDLVDSGNVINKNNIETVEEFEIEDIEGSVIIFDNTPTEGSSNAVTSSGIKDYVDSGFVPEAPQDGKKYVRSNGGWVEADTELSIFITRWNYLCGSYGRYNESTGYFELNNDSTLDNTNDEPEYNVTLRTLSYEDAWDIIERANWINNDLVGIGNAGKTNIPQQAGYLGYSPYWTYSNCFRANSSLVYVRTTNIIKADLFVFSECSNLVYIKGSLSNSGVVTSSDSRYRIYNCPKLEYFTLYATPTATCYLETLTSLTRECIMYNFVDRKTTTTELIVNIEQEVYDRLTEDDLASASAVNTTFAIY